MIHSSAILADAASQTIWQFVRVQEAGDWLLPGALFVACTLFVIYMCLADCTELGVRYAIVLISLRLAALTLLFLVYLHPEKRTQRTLVHPSRLVLLCDTSGSMALADSSPSREGGATQSRLDAVKNELATGGLLSTLARTHDVVVAAFDSSTRRIGHVEKLKADEVESTPDGRPLDAPDWLDTLLPQGTETGLGHAIQDLVQEEKDQPISGIVVFSDGAHNSGLDPQSAIQTARDARIPLYTVGVGSSQGLANVAVRDVVAPERVYPGDDFTVTAFVDGSEMAGRQTVIELIPQAAGELTAPASHQMTRPIQFGQDGEMVPVRFELPGLDRDGRYRFRLEIQAPSNDINADDNSETFDVDVVEQKTNVLLFAGGPSREYRFLRDQLYRDRGASVDVLLQSAVGDIAQDARKILSQFPADQEELFAYDCLIAFDPNWKELPPQQIDLLETWIAEQSGGLIVIAGPVFTDRWVQDAELAKLRSLYPVEFYQRFTRFESGRYGALEPRRVILTEEGMNAEFLWLDDSRTTSEAAWKQFPGVFGYYDVRGAKPGATVYAHCGNNAGTALSRDSIYMAGQFYGSGRVFYLGSGEMWRTRTNNEVYFEKFYTKLIRHVSQGRLLRGSNRGILLVERDRFRPGETVQIRARLMDRTFRPLELAEAALEIRQPDGGVAATFLKRNTESPGMYQGQFTPTSQGSYEIVLPVPESRNESLSRRIQVRMPELERENPQLNEFVLAKLAAETGGQYYHGVAATRGGSGIPPLATQLKDRTRTSYLIGPPDRLWEQTWLQWLLAGVCGILCLEWLLRRFWRLA